jgi:uncharacterized protein YcaQ
MRRLTIAQARRLALGAQGFADPRPTGRVDLRHLRRVVQQVGAVQLDSVNVVARAHYLTFFARLGPYPMALADRLGWESGEMVEYWAHEAALIPAERWPLFRHRMEATAHQWPGMARWMTSNPEIIAEVFAQVEEQGPIRPADLSDHHDTQKGPWWDWSHAKLALEGLFFSGRLTVARRVNFVRHYDLPERVLPPEVVERRVEETVAKRTLLRLATRHHGVGTVHDLADYYRFKPSTVAPLLAAMAGDGEIVEVEVEGWKGPVYADPEAVIPRRITGVALLSPFDPVVWFRPRAERLFNFHYRIEIYTPPAKRIYGYYVFPVLFDGELVGRVDLKADRARGVLAVRGSYAEPGQDPRRIAPALVEELRAMASWLSLSEVEVSPKGDLAPALAGAMG